jgi:transglutaminase-like putative cysteine protease
MRYLATHLTRYSYADTASQCVSEAYITPRVLPWQKVIETNITIDPEPVVFIRRKDYFGNDVVDFSVFQPHAKLTATARSIVEVEPRDAEGAMRSIPWEQARERLAAQEDEATMEAYEFIFDSPYVAGAPKLGEYAMKSLTPGRPLAEAAREMATRINKDFKYKPKSTSIHMPLLNVFELRRGVCQDFAHIMIGALRTCRLAARYVSGYLRSGANLQGSEASHAWVSVFIPGYGWLDLDPTNDVIPSAGHVTVAWGRDFGDVTPVKGITLGGGKHSVEVEVTVRPAP